MVSAVRGTMVAACQTDAGACLLADDGNAVFPPAVVERRPRRPGGG